MHTLTLVFLVFLTVSAGIRLWLASRQRASLVKHRDAVPDLFAGRIPPEAHRKAAEYGLARVRLEQIEVVVAALLTVAWTLGGGLEALDRAWRALEWGPLATGTAFVMSAFVLMSLLDLPLDAYRTFRIEQRHGFNRTTPALFLRDLLKQGALAIALGTPLAAVLLYLMQSAGAWWWFYGWLVWAAFTAFIVWAYPQYIAPLFNHFTELEDAELKRRVLQLLARNGFRSEGVYVMDGSTRSGHGNAYFTGLGAAKRIVFFDTLLESLTHDEVEAVLAHELGHYKHGHVRKQLLISTALTFIGFAALGWLAHQLWFYTALGVSEPSPHAALILFLLVVPAFTFFLAPVGAYWRRRHEFEADRYAAEHTGKEPLITALLKLYKDNASSVTPDPLYSAYHDSHPPAPVRIAHLRGTLAAPS